MLSFCWCGDGGRKLLSMALSCVTIVMATSVTARLMPNVTEPVSSAEQEPLLTDVLVVAVQEIARALKRNVELATNNFSWIKVALFGFGGLIAIEILKIFTGIITHYLEDYLRKTWPHWNSQMPPPVKDVLEPLERMAMSSERQLEVMKHLRSDVAALRSDVVNRPADVANLQLKDELKPLIEYLKKWAEALATSSERQSAEIVDLRSEMKREYELIEVSLRNSQPHPDDFVPDPIEGEHMIDADPSSSYTE